VIVGILSDTHGKLAATQAGLAALKQAGAEFFIHCGDVGGKQIFDLFAGLPMAFVWGNCDFDRGSLQKYAVGLGLEYHDDPADLTLDGKRIAVTHGDHAEIFQKLLSERKHDYLFHGHTHVARDQKLNGMRVINPGALHRSARPTVAVLDTQTGQVRLIPVNAGGQGKRMKDEG
jgi:uncharacterized protein